MGKVLINIVIRMIIVSIFLGGCAAYVTQEGTYIEPLPTTVVIGPPVIVAPPRHLVVRSLPPVIYYPNRPSLYYYNNIYYYDYHGKWYYGEHDKGPWHKLPKKYYPPHKKRYERSKERGRY
jgi:hypothetical protein